MRTFDSAPPSFSTSMARVAVFAFAMAVSTRASATPGFPEVIRQELGMEENPHCALCHVGTPARGTVQTPFGKYMRSRGLVARSDSSLKNALRAATGERQDSDGDGTTDVDELKAGQDPNGDQPEFGCVGRIASGKGDARAFLAFGLALVAIVTVRRRHTRAER